MRVIEEKEKKERYVILAEDWYFSKIYPGDYIHVILDSSLQDPSCNESESTSIRIDNKHNKLIIHPDSLITGTAVGESFTCVRKSVLNQHAKVILYLQYVLNM